MTMATQEKTVSKKERKNAKYRRALKKAAKGKSSVVAAKPKSSPKTTVTTEPSSFWSWSGMRAYFKSVSNEAKRVTWPTGTELYAATVVVMITLVFFTCYLYLFNSLFDRVFSTLGY